MRLIKGGLIRTQTGITSEQVAELCSRDPFAVNRQRIGFALRVLFFAGDLIVRLLPVYLNSASTVAELLGSQLGGPSSSPFNQETDDVFLFDVDVCAPSAQGSLLRVHPD